MARGGKILSAEIETKALLRAIDRAPQTVERYTTLAAKQTAYNIVRNARALVAKRTRETERQLVVKPDYSGHGFVVKAEVDRLVVHHRKSTKTGKVSSHVQRQTQSNVPLWLEFGTVHMTKRPFFFESARLEAKAHDRRMRDAIKLAIETEGLGE